MRELFAAGDGNCHVGGAARHSPDENPAGALRAAMTDDLNEFDKVVFKAGQQPAAWLRSAGRLRDVAEAIIQHELPAERLYSQARKVADEEALAQAERNGTDFGTAEIKAIAPKYPPAQLLYAYAIAQGPHRTQAP